MSDDLIKRFDAIKDLCDITNNSDMPEDWHRGMSSAISALYRVPSADRPSAVDLSSVYSTAYKSGYEKGKTDRPQGEWVEKPHKVYLPRDYEPDINDYRDRQYNEENHSIVQYWWHCNQCDFEADRWIKPTFNFCPSCGAKMKGADDE